MLEKYVLEISEDTYKILNNSQIPTSIIYSNTKNLPSYLLAKDNSIAIRIIDHPYITPLIKQFNSPIVSTSANISGFDAPKQFSDVHSDILKNVDAIMPEKMDVSVQSNASRIIIIEPNGSLKWIRK